MSSSRECPSVEQLQELAIGRLPDPPAGELEEHLLSCEACAQQTAELQPSDTLVSAMRAAKGAAAARSPEEQAQLDRLRKSLSGLRAGPLEATVQSDPQGTCAAVQQEADDVTQELSAMWQPAQQSDELGRLGGYRVLKLLGAGGMGAVFVAEDIQLQRRVALKVMRPHAATAPGAAERFLREARAAAAVKHEHVVTIYQVGEAVVAQPSGSVSIPFLAQELLKGESLEERLRRPGSLSIDEVIRIGEQIAEGLSAAHAKGLIHRDIKPANVWLERNRHAPHDEPNAPAILGEQTATSERPTSIGHSAHHVECDGYVGGGEFVCVKLLDFGLARGMDDDSRITSSGMIVGTPSYMAPEQASGEQVDQRADLFSLGCVLYRMTTGRLPFPGKKALEVLQALANVTPVSPREVNPDVPPPLSDLIDRLLRKDRSARPASARDVARELRAIESSRTRESSDRSLTTPATAFPAVPFSADATTIELESQTKAGTGKCAHPTKRWLISAAFAGACILFGVVVIKLRDKDGRETKISVDAPKGTRLVAVEQSDPNESPAAKSEDERPLPKNEGESKVLNAAVNDYAFHLQPKQAIVVDTAVLMREFSDPFTLELWVQPNNDPASPRHWDIIAGASHTNGSFALQLNKKMDQPTIVASYHDGATNSTHHTRGFALAESRWMHVAGVCEQQGIHLFIDGKRIATRDLPVATALGGIRDIRIGNETGDFMGAVDEIRLSRGVRYKADFKPAARFEPDDDTLILLHCDEGRGEWMRDASGRGNDGRISQSPKLPVRWVRADGSAIKPSENDRP